MRSALLVAIILALPPALALPGGPAAWVVTGTETFEGVPLVLAQDVVVMPGGALRLRGVDAAVVATPHRALEITVRAGGELQLVDGAHALSGQTTPTRLAATAGAFALRVEPGGVLRVENATLVGGRLSLDGAGAAIEGSRLVLSNGALVVAGGAAVVRSSTLEGSPGNLVEVHAGHLLVEGSLLQAAGSAAAVVRSAGALTLRGSTVGQTQDYGLRVEGGALVAEANRFDASAAYAAFVSGGAVELRNNTWRTHCAAFLVGGATGTVSGNVFEPIDNGLTLAEAGPLAIHNNTFRGTKQALFIGSSSPGVRDNIFEANERAVVLSEGSPAIERNRFAANGASLEVKPWATAPLVRHNSFEDATGYEVKNANAAPLDARHNWWGSTTGPAAGALVGAVDAAPWLASAP